MMERLKEQTDEQNRIRFTVYSSRFRGWFFSFPELKRAYMKWFGLSLIAAMVEMVVLAMR
jgi:hypothetical protein